MSRFVLIVPNEAAPERKASGKGTGIGQVELVPDVELVEPRAFFKMDRKKLWRLHFVFMSHRGNEFKKAGTCTVEAPSPGAFIEASAGQGAEVSSSPKSCIRGPVGTRKTGSLASLLVLAFFLCLHLQLRLRLLLARLG
jgi:hypothetical protein